MTALALRASALTRAADPLAHEALHHGELVLTEAVTAWESSTGRMAGHRVVLALEAGLLGRVLGAPHVVDAIAAAIAGAVADDARASLADLVFVWRPDSAPHTAGYRDAPPTTRGRVRVPLSAAMVAFLTGRGEIEAAHAAARARVTEPGARAVAITIARTDRRAEPALRAALHALLGAAEAKRARFVVDA